MATRTIEYVPILKSKAGERWALSHLKTATKSVVRPLIELHPNSNKVLRDHVESLCEGFQAAWGEDRWLYVDTIWLHDASGSASCINTVFETTERFNLKAVPVIRPTYDDTSLEELREIIEATDRGCLLRITREVLKTPQLLSNLLEALTVKHKAVDLMLDYRHSAMNLAGDLQQIPAIQEWRLLISASGVFPGSLSTYPHDEWHEIPRYDWSSWNNAVSAGLSRKPIYSDYTMRAPGAPPDFGAPSVNLRYCTDSTWLVKVGGKVSDGASPEMHDMAQELISRSEYSGIDFSAGDEEISRVTDDDEGPGGSTQWLQWCASHHIEYVVHQVINGAA